VSEELPAAGEAAVKGAQSDGRWGSVLACQELAAVGSVGFAPVGQVFGAAVYDAGAASASSCPGTAGAPGGETTVPSAAQAPGQGDPGGFGPLVEAMYQVRQAAVDRMTAECAALGGHGVVGVRLSAGRLPSAGWSSRPSAPRCPRPGRGSLSPRDPAKS
jgi:putative heavy-metal-binding protein